MVFGGLVEQHIGPKFLGTLQGRTLGGGATPPAPIWWWGGGGKRPTTIEMVGGIRGGEGMVGSTGGAWGATPSPRGHIGLFSRRQRRREKFGT